MLYIFLAVISCCLNVVFLEILIRDLPGCGNVVTFFQFLFIALEGLIFTSRCGTVKPAIPIKNYMLLVVMFFLVSVSNNWALNYNISMPLHMIFKSGSLVTSMLMGILILKKQYSLKKYLSVFMVTFGIFVSTWASQHPEANQNVTQLGGQHEQNQSLIGIALLLFSLVVSAGLGIYQETIFKKYGKHPKEALFYSHALPLPGFLFLANDIASFLPLLSNSAPINIFSVIKVPVLWLHMTMNVLTQYICVRSVFTIASKYSSLTVTMIITCRKFISLMFSIAYFKNPFTLLHWFGTFLVFSGTILFTDLTKSFERNEQKDKLN